MFFGTGGRGGRAQRGKDVIHQLGVTLEELYNGSLRKLALQKNVVCDKCEGRLADVHVVVVLLVYLLRIRPLMSGDSTEV